MSELKIIGWTNFDSNYPTKAYNQEELNQVVNLIRDEIAKNGYRFSGNDHQYVPCCVPVFSDGTCFRASMRCWGSIMALVHSNELQLSYMDFYCDTYGEVVHPKTGELTVQPCELEKNYPGYTLQEDIQILSESLSVGIPFLTTDKVLKVICDMVKNEIE